MNPAPAAVPLSGSRSLEDLLDPISKQTEPVRLLCLRNFTLEPVKEFLRKEARAQSFDIAVEFGNFGTVSQDLLALQTRTAPPPQFLLITLIADFFGGFLWTPQWSLTSAREELISLLNLAETASRCPVVLTTFVPPTYVRLDGAGRIKEIAALNECIRGFVSEHPSKFHLIDCEVIARRLGEEKTIDARMALMAKSPFKRPFLEALSRSLINLILARKGKGKKVIVTDADNTLWGGIVGEQGRQGIALDPYEYPGIAYHQYQSDLLMLKERGVLIAICSKNNHEDVWDVLQNHPHSLLRPDDIAAARINWEDKASNLASLANELNLGLDSFIFIDDNASECDLIHQSFPEVQVIQVPAQICDLPHLLLREGTADKIVVTPEDLQRTKLYSENRVREQARTRSGNLEGFLQSLQLKVEVRSPKVEELERVSQLTQKTNQFNLTSKRYDSMEIDRLFHDRKSRLYVISAKDKFGDLGLSGVIIFRLADDFIEIDTFLLSCRILGRAIEDYAFTFALQDVRALWGGREVYSSYVPNGKNAQVKDLYSRWGFRELAPGVGETQRFVAAIDIGLPSLPTHITPF